jgi:hypothetical protein
VVPGASDGDGIYGPCMTIGGAALRTVGRGVTDEAQERDMSDELELGEGGWTRRKVLTRGAMAGGLVWAAPAVTTVGSKVLAQTGSPRDQDISFVAILASCDGVTYRVKWEVGSDGTTLNQECGPNFAVDGCSDQLLRHDSSVATGCGSFSAWMDGDNLVVDLGTCTLSDFVVKCGVPSDPGDSGCQDPEDRNQPNTGATGEVTFHPCLLPS